MGGTKYKHFYGNQSEQFTFYKVPKQLFVDEEFHNISAEAKLLYGILLDRMSLSSANGWRDEEGKGVFRKLEMESGTVDLLRMDIR